MMERWNRWKSKCNQDNKINTQQQQEKCKYQIKTGVWRHTDVHLIKQTIQTAQAQVKKYFISQ